MEKLDLPATDDGFEKMTYVEYHQWKGYKDSIYVHRFYHITKARAYATAEIVEAARMGGDW